MPAVTPESRATAAEIGNNVGDRAPDFRLSRVGGGEVTLADFQGKPLVIYFFATWWPYCRAEFRLLKDLYPEHQEEVAFLAVGVDPSEENQIAGFHEDNSFPWITSPGDPTMIVEYSVRAVPSKMALDGDGIIVHKLRSGSKPEVEWRQLFEELAAGQSL